MRDAGIAMLCGLLLSLAPATAQRGSQPVAPGKPSAARLEAKAPARRAVAPKRPARRASSRRAARRSRVASWRLGQQQPTPERYREIQEALIARGYLEGPATGIWGPESVEALRKFQQDNHLEVTGKINSLSLIALGLGPRRDSAALNGQPKPEAAQP